MYFNFFLAALGLPCCAWAFSSCGQWGLLSWSGAQCSHCVGFSSCGAQVLGTQASAVVAQGLTNGGSRALERADFSSYGARA